MLTFLGHINKRQYLKIYSLKFDEIWQKSCSYTFSVNEESDTNKFLAKVVLLKSSKTVRYNLVNLFLKRVGFLLLDVCQFIRKSNDRTFG